MSTNPPSDQELLRRFQEDRNEQAFTELYRRYAPVVSAVCRRMLHDAHLAEDATNAAFLVLAKEAGVMSRDTRPLGGWLHRVATNIARNCWRREYRRRLFDQAVGDAATSQPADDDAAEQRWAQLHREIEDLPERYRIAIVLHYLEGRSYDEAAAALGWNQNTFGVRLARGRERLRKRLVARGVTFGADGVAGLLAEERATSVTLPAAVVAATCRAAIAVAAGKTLTGLVSPQVVTLTKSALKLLFWAKVKTAAVTAAVSVAVVAGGAVAAHQALAHRQPVVAQATVPTAVKGGQVWAWGDNQFGQLGDGTTSTRTSPVPVPGLANVTAVVTCGGYTVVLRRDRTVWTWGHNRFGQLGDGTTTQRLTPVPVRLPDGTPLADITAVAVAGTHAIALTTDGRIWAWGDNRFGQIGDGTTERRVNPVPVPGVTDVLAIAAGGAHTVILKRDRTVWAWGQNSSGQLGDGTTATRLTPVQARNADGTPLADVLAIAAGRRHTVTLKDDHTVWTCGDNFYDQLGPESRLSTRSRPTFAPVPALAGVMAIAAGPDYTLARKDDRTVWHWGAYGAMAVTSTDPRPVMQAPGAPLTNVIAIAAGDDQAVALLADGTLVTWGGSAPAAVPVTFPENVVLANITAIAAGGGHTAVLVTER